MRRHHPENELAKRNYLDWLAHAHGRDAATLDQVAAALHRFEAFTGFASFKSFRREQAVSFKRHLSDERSASTGKPLSKASLFSICRALRMFFEWLSREPGYRRHVLIGDAAYFNVTENDARIATASRERPAPALEQVQRVITSMPDRDLADRRDRAVVALILLTGARDAAVASLRIKHVDLARGMLVQDSREVRTKRAKDIRTTFFPVGDDVEQIVRDWVRELTCEQDFGPDDPLFPASRPTLSREAGRSGLSRKGWTSAAPIRAIFKRAFEAAGLPYYPPHSLRKTLVRRAYDLDLGVREMKAWSQNLGHSSMLTSLNSYGAVPAHEQEDLIRTAAHRMDDAFMREIAAVVKRRGY